MPADRPTPSAAEFQIRLATPEELPAIAELYLEVRAAAPPHMPPIARSPGEVRAYVTSWDLTRRQVWVADVSQDGHSAVRAFASVEPRWLSGLYVAPELAGQGVGGTLVELVKQLRPGGFALWVFESNTPARALYRKHGLVELERTDGSLSDEKQPDIKMAWLGHSPRGFLEELLAEADRDQADLDLRRAALQRALDTLDRSSQGRGGHLRRPSSPRSSPGEAGGYVARAATENCRRCLSRSGDRVA